MFDRKPIPSIVAEIRKLEETERRNFEPIKKALLEEVRIETARRSQNIQNMSPAQTERHLQDIETAEAVRRDILGKGQGFDNPRFTLGLSGRYTEGGTVGSTYSVSSLLPDDTNRIFDVLSEHFDAKIVNALRIKMARETAEAKLKETTNKEKREMLQTFLKSLK